jgi:hypothetical protein
MHLHLWQGNKQFFTGFPTLQAYAGIKPRPLPCKPFPILHLTAYFMLHNPATDSIVKWPIQRKRKTKNQLFPEGVKWFDMVCGLPTECLGQFIYMYNKCEETVFAFSKCFDMQLKGVQE